MSVSEIMKETKEFISISISSIIHNLEAFGTKHDIDTAKLETSFLNMKIDKNGVYYAEFDCWQSAFGYNKL